MPGDVATARAHAPGELTLVGADERCGRVAYAAASGRLPWVRHRVVLDLPTGRARCSCPGARLGRCCWHLALVRAAWAGHPARLAAAGLDEADLVETVKRAARRCAVYRARGWRVPLADRLLVLACRDEYAARRGAGEGAA